MKTGIVSAVLLAVPVAMIWFAMVPRKSASKHSIETIHRSQTPAKASPELIETVLRGTNIMRWPVRNEGHGMPPNGSLVLLRQHTSEHDGSVPSRGIVHDGHIVVADWTSGFWQARAIIPGFGCALLRAVDPGRQGSPVAFRPLGSVTVTVKAITGKPLRGARATVLETHAQGMNRFAKTDAQGRAHITDLYSGPDAIVACRITGWGNLPIDRTFRDIDLHIGNASLEHIVPAFVSIPLHLRVTVNGAPPPADFDELANIYIHRAEDPKAKQGDDDQESLEDALRETLEKRADYPRGNLNWHDGQQVRLRPDSHGVCSFRITAFASANRIELSLESRRYRDPDLSAFEIKDDQPVQVELALATEGSAHVHVRPPKDGFHYITLERWNDDAGAWMVGRSHNETVDEIVPDARGLAMFWDLPVGRYRAVDTISLTASAPFDVTADGGAAKADLDLSQCGWARGVVEVPDGGALAAVRLLRSDTVGYKFAMPHRKWKRMRFSRETGAFRCRVPTGRAIDLAVRHPILSPHQTQGSIRIEQPGDDHRLQLVRTAGTLLRFSEPLPEPSDTLRVSRRPRPEGAPNCHEVSLVSRTGVRKTSVSYLNAARDTLEFGAVPTGQYTIEIDSQTTAPIIVPNVTITDGINEVEDVQWSPGATLRITFTYSDSRLKKETPIHLLSLDATPINPPRFKRFGTLTRDGGEIRGLAAGMYRVSFRDILGELDSQTEVIEFDGKTEIKRSFPIR